MATEEELRALVEKLIPIYTSKNPNPVTGKADCPLKVRQKTFMREHELKKLMEQQRPNDN
jgi:hypothetical protein